MSPFEGSADGLQRGTIGVLKKTRVWFWSFRFWSFPVPCHLEKCLGLRVREQNPSQTLNPFFLCWHGTNKDNRKDPNLICVFRKETRNWAYWLKDWWGLEADRDWSRTLWYKTVMLAGWNSLRPWKIHLPVWSPGERLISGEVFPCRTTRNKVRVVGFVKHSVHKTQHLNSFRDAWSVPTPKLKRLTLANWISETMQNSLARALLKLVVIVLATNESIQENEKQAKASVHVSTEFVWRTLFS